jgi:SagB-type dehydrogenase family enzyme
MAANTLKSEIGYVVARKFHIKLPEPQKELEFPLMKAREKRRSIRKWKTEPICDQDLSNLLWAACGVTQKGTKTRKSKRTCPSACISQEIKIYVAVEKGLFQYNEEENELIQILTRDIRKEISTQQTMHSAPVGLIYVADYSKYVSPLFKNDDLRWFFSGADTGFISQNVYLYCAAANLSTVVLGLVKREKLHKIMGLKEREKIVFTQVVGKSID